MADQVLANVFTYDPAKDAKPAFKTYEVPWKQYMTVSEVLRYIFEEHESIAFDYSCRSKMCGRCAVMVNAEPKYACFTAVQPGAVTIEPLKGFPVIRDLVVDKSKFKSRLDGLRFPLQRTSTLEEIPNIPYETFQTIDMLEQCRECGMCQTVCPIINEQNDFEKFSGPAAMMHIALRHYDPKDESDRVAQAVFEGLWECTMCGSCQATCMMDITHLDVLRDLRDTAETRGLKPS